MTELQSLLIANMKRNRTRLGLTQSALAERCDLSPNFMSSIESGKRFPSVDTLQKIVDALGVKPYQLFLDDHDVLGQDEAILRYYEGLKNKMDLMLMESIRPFLPGDEPDGK